MKISKRNLDKIDQISLVFDVLEEYGESWCRHSPEEWGRAEKQLYEMVNTLEMRVKTEVLKIISGAPAEKKKESMPKTKASIYCWAGESGTILEKAGYKDRQEIDSGTVFTVAQKLFEAGLNVMVYRNRETDGIVLFVDTQRFQQR